MPKTSRSSNVRARRASIPKHSTRARKGPPRVRALTDGEAHIDGCDVDFTESEATPDAELPEATGGVEIVRGRQRRTAPRRR